MNFWIIGIDHELQLTRADDDSVKLRALKDQLDAMLRIGLRERNIDFIAEESKKDRATLGSELADANYPRIPWTNIWMSDAERLRFGIACLGRLATWFDLNSGVEATGYPRTLADVLARLCGDPVAPFEYARSRR